MAHSGSIIVAAAKGTTWGSGVTCNTANKGILILDDPDFIERPDQLLDESMGFIYPEYIDAGNRNTNPTIGGWLRYTNNQYALIALAIGDDSSVLISGSEFTHTMDIQDSTAGLFVTLCAFDGVTVREIPSWKPTGFTFSGSGGDFWKFSVPGIGNKILLSGQTNTTLGSVTPRSEILRVPFGATTFRINDRTAGALSSTDNIKPTSCEVTFTRAIERETVARAVAEGSGEWETEEPLENGMPRCTVKVTLPEYTAIEHLEDLVDETEKKMSIVATGPTVGATNYTFSLEFPALRVVDVVTSFGAGRKRIPKELTMEALMAQSAPTGMTGITKLFRLKVIDQQSAGYDT